MRDIITNIITRITRRGSIGHIIIHPDLAAANVKTHTRMTTLRVARGTADTESHVSAEMS